MASFAPNKIDLSQIHSGQRYQNGDVVDANAINAPIEASAWAQRVANEAKLLAEAASGSTTDAFMSAIRDVVAPFHQVMIFTDGTNPSEKYGGYWLKIKDAFLWASGDTASITYSKNGVQVTESLSASKRGGEYSHKLTVEEMPAHYHETSQGVFHNPTDGNNLAYNWGSDYQRPQGTGVITTTTVGGGQDHNNMPPYYAVNAWVRVTEEEFNANESL
jgi:hypothetical protein